jgi:hypothetical protein
MLKERNREHKGEFVLSWRRGHEPRPSQGIREQEIVAEAEQYVDQGLDELGYFPELVNVLRCEQVWPSDRSTCPPM